MADTQDHQDKQTFLEEISAFETSPTKYPANRWMSVFQKSHKENSMFAKALELLEKSGMSEKAKSACKKAMEALEGAKGEFDAAQFKSFRKALAFGGEETEAEEAKEAEEKKAMKKSADDATVALETVKDLVKKSIGALDMSEPKVKDALDLLAPVVGHKPVHQIIAEMPAAARAQVEMLQKSYDGMKGELEALRKGQLEQTRKDRVRELVQKSAATLKHVPLSADEMGQMMADVIEASPKAGEALERMLNTVEGVMAKSALIGRELGSSARKPSDTSAEAEIDRLAAALVQKSAEGGEKVPLSKAWNMVLDLHPELGKRYDAEKSARSAGVGLGQ